METITSLMTCQDNIMDSYSSNLSLESSSFVINSLIS